MANKKITGLPSATALTGAEPIETVQSGISVQTTTQDIADLGGGGSGMVLLASGTITVSTLFVDLALPSGYDLFVIDWTNLSGGTNSFAIAVSDDAGATWYNDTTNFDTYLSQRLDAHATNTTAHLYTDSLSLISDTNIADVYCKIWPGNDTASFRLYTVTLEAGSGGSYLTYWYDWLNPAAINPPDYGRINMMRFMQYGNGDIPQTDLTDLITAGTYFVWGVPTP